MKDINKIIYCFTLFVSAFFFSVAAYAGPCTEAHNYTPIINEDCTWNCKLLGTSTIACGTIDPNGTNWGNPDVSGYKDCCARSGSTYVLNGCKWSNRTEQEFSGTCRLGTRQRRYRTLTGKVVHCNAVEQNKVLDVPFTYSSWSSWTNVSNNTSYCTKDCTGWENKIQYQIINGCTEQARKCCSKGYWTDWGKTGCNSSGYVSGS